MNGGAALRSLTAREFRRFVRQPTRIAAAVGTPLMLWAFLAAGFAESFAPPGESADAYAAFLLPGMATLVVLFSSIFASMSLIEDRHEGFLQSALVSPAPRWSIASAKAIGGAAIATAQGGLLLLAGAVIGVWPGLGGYIAALGVLGMIALAVTGVGLAAAWVVNSSEGFHGVMNALLMPMWLLSGALFPLDGAAGWLEIVMRLDPLTWSTESLRWALGQADEAPLLSLGGAVVFAAFGVGVATATMSGTDRR